MNTTQLPFLVEEILILASMILGFLLHRAGRPYGKVKLALHFFLFLWFTVGFAFILYGLFALNVTMATWIPVALMCLMILTQLVTGVLMLASKKAGKVLPRIHIISAILLVVSDICAFIITGKPS